MTNTNWLITEMDEVRNYCHLILKARTGAGFISLKYPVISATLDRYFLPVHRKMIADECNLVGYMSEFPPVVYDSTQNVSVILDTQRSPWQEAMYQERVARREEAERRKAEDNYVKHD